MSLFGNYSLGSDQCSGPDVPHDSHDEVPLQFNSSRRTSVSAECPMPNVVEAQRVCDRLGSSVSGSESTDSSSLDTPQPLSPHKASACAAKLRASLRNIFLFKDLSDDSLNLILNSLVCKRANSGSDIIVQGDEGDYLYIVESGSVEYYINGKLDGSSGAGSYFGELALLYNSPRAATVRASADCTLWLLDRATFKQIMIRKRSDKREHSRAVLASSEIFSGLPQSCQLKIADALQPVTYEAGDVIVSEGDKGENFYLIDEGEVEITSHESRLATQSRGSYFGELALIYDAPRRATVTALTQLKLEKLSKDGFERLIGPAVVEQLRQRAPPTN